MTARNRRTGLLAAWLGILAASPTVVEAARTPQRPAPTATPSPTPLPTVCPSPDPNRELPYFYGLDIYEENDSAFEGDERYTQGLKVSMAVNPKKARWVKTIADQVGRLFWPGSDESLEPGFAFTIGQNMYTPTVITSKKLDKNDRAFSGFAYIGGQLSATNRSATTRHLLELDLGFLGQDSLSKFAQSGLHVIKTSRIPKGWEQANPKGGGGFNLYYRREDRTGRMDGGHDVRWDLTAGPAAELGNVRRSVGAHAALRLGWRITGFPATVIASGLRASEQPSARPPSEIGFIAGVEGRQVFHTKLVRPTQGGAPFGASLPVFDRRLGFFFRLSSFRFTAQKVWRSAEFEIQDIPQRNQDFITVAASYEPTLGGQCASCIADSLGKVFHYTEIELGMGQGLSGPTLSPNQPRGIAGHLALRIKAYKNFTVGAELGSIGVTSNDVQPGNPDNGYKPDDAYADLFLRQSALTIGYRPFGRTSGLALRAGSSFLGQRIRIQQLRHRVQEGVRFEDSSEHHDYKIKRGGWLVGAQFFQPIESRVAFGFDFTLRSMRAGEAVPGLVKPRFAQFVFGVQIRP